MLASPLVAGYRVVLVDANDYAAHVPGVVRALVTGDARTAPLRTATVFKRKWGSQGAHVVVHARVLALAPGVLELDTPFEGSTQLPFEKCILALGATGLGRPEPGVSLEKYREGLQESADAIEHAAEILIAGGGPAGVELAGEITSRYPDKRIVLVHRGQYLSATAAEGEPSARRVALGTALFGQLCARGVWIHVNERVDGGHLAHVGTRVTADHVLWATGGKPNTGFLGADMLAANGAVTVDNAFRTAVAGVYAVGDCCSSPGRKTAGQAAAEGAACARIVLEHMRGRESSYDPRPNEGIVVPLGDRGGTYPRAVQGYTDGIGAGIVDLGWAGVYDAPAWFIRWFHRDYFYKETFRVLFRGSERIP